MPAAEPARFRPLSQYIEGRGTLIDAHTVEVNGKRFTAKNILIATGGRAVIPPIPGENWDRQPLPASRLAASAMLGWYQ